MARAARLAERRGVAVAGLAGEIEGVLRGLGLPTEPPPGLDRNRVLAAIGVDKKRSAGQVRLALPVRIGEVRWGIPLENPEELLG
jgi:3-dehydroquinate synthetase